MTLIERYNAEEGWKHYRSYHEWLSDQPKTEEVLWALKVGEIRSFLGRGEAGDPLRERAVHLANDWNELVTELTQKFGTTAEDGADWQDFESDEALRSFIFWWTWGN